jgi:TIR domain
MIAISYRREDTAQITGRIYDRLREVFGQDQVFIDLDSIPFGVDFRTRISESLDQCHTLLVVIGSHWLGACADGSRRIDDPTDFVRLEVAQALARNIRVIPLLIDRSEMPSCNILPEELKNLAFRNALRVDPGADFNHHIAKLCKSLQPARPAPPANSPQPEIAPSSPQWLADQPPPSTAQQTASPRKPADQQLRQSRKFLFKSITLLFAIPIGLLLIAADLVGLVKPQGPVAIFGGIVVFVSIVWVLCIRVPQHLKGK